MIDGNRFMRNVIRDALVINAVAAAVVVASFGVKKVINALKSEPATNNVTNTVASRSVPIESNGVSYEKALKIQAEQNIVGHNRDSLKNVLKNCKRQLAHPHIK